MRFGALLMVMALLSLSACAPVPVMPPASPSVAPPASPTPVPSASPSAAPPTPSPTPPPAGEAVTIGEILANPKAYAGREVTVVAYFRGWDLLGEVEGGPPRTMSDVAVADATGGIYIVFAGPEARGDLPPLPPQDRKSTETLLRLRGTVQIAPSGRPYLLVTKGEAMKGLPARVLLRVRRTGGSAGVDQELMALSDGTLYFLDRRARGHVRWKAEPGQVVRAAGGMRPFLDREVGAQTPDGFAWTVAVQDGEQVKTAVFYEGKLSAEVGQALAPVQGWFDEATSRLARPATTPGPYPGPVMAAVRALADQLGIPAEQIAVAAWEPVDWPDASLGCPEPGMAYAQVITPGYQVLLEARGETYHAHTDRSGQRVVFCFP